MKNKLTLIGLMFMITTNALADTGLLTRVIDGETYAISEEIVTYTKIPGVWQKLGETTDPALVYNTSTGNIDICGAVVLEAFSSVSCAPLKEFNEVQ